MKERNKRGLWHCTTLRIAAIEMPTTWIANERFSSGQLHHFTLQSGRHAPWEHHAKSTLLCCGDGVAPYLEHARVVPRLELFGKSVCEVIIEIQQQQRSPIMVRNEGRCMMATTRVASLPEVQYEANMDYWVQRKPTIATKYFLRHLELASF